MRRCGWVGALGVLTCHAGDTVGQRLRMLRPPQLFAVPCSPVLMASPPLPRRWRLWCCWQQHLRRLHVTLQGLQPRLCLLLGYRRWQAAVHAAQADDASLCHQAVQLPRAFAAWRRLAREQAQLLRLGEACRRASEHRQRRRMLAAWRLWAGGKRAARAQHSQTAAHFAARTAQAVLVGWRQAAASRAARRQQQLEAAAHWVLRRMAVVFGRWRRWAALRRQAPQAHALHLLRSTFGAWRQETRRKAAKAAQLRLAVRQHYLQRLWAGWAAWQQHHQRRQQKRQRLAAMCRHREATLLWSCLAAWHGPFLAAACSKRAAAQVAAQHCAFRLLRLVLAGWRGPFLLHARSSAAAAARTDSFRSAVLLSRSLAGWQLWRNQQAEKRQQLEAARALLRPGRPRRLLLAWRHVCATKAALRWQVSNTTGHALQGLGSLAFLIEVQFLTCCILFSPAGSRCMCHVPAAQAASGLVSAAAARQAPAAQA